MQPFQNGSIGDEGIIPLHKWVKNPPVRGGVAEWNGTGICVLLSFVAGISRFFPGGNPFNFAKPHEIQQTFHSDNDQESPDFIMSEPILICFFQ